MLKECKNYYSAGKEPEIQEFGEAVYLTIEGQGEPGGDIFRKKVEALYPLAYKRKRFSNRKGLILEFQSWRVFGGLKTADMLSKSREVNGAGSYLSECLIL